jgi:hypothetical protein
MATIDYNSGDGPVTFFPSNVSSPVLFCVNNKGGIDIATGTSTPTVPNTIRMGDLLNASSRLEINTQQLDVQSVTMFHSSIQFGELYGSGYNSRMNRDSITLNNGAKKMTLTEKGLSSTDILLDVMGGNLNVSGTVLTEVSKGLNSKYLTIQINGNPYKIALHNA